LHRQTTQAVVAVALLVSVAGPADALESAGQLLGACERFLQVVDLSGPRFDIPREEPEAIMCWAFMRAVQDLSTVSFAGKRALYTCPPEQTFVSHLIREFVSYAREHPQALHLPPGHVAMVALQTAFPCTPPVQ
jgi:hypothetical protein